MPATPPAPVLDALTRLATDRADLDGLYGDKAAAEETLARAVNADAVAGNALSGAKTNFDADKSALITLIQTTFTSGPPSPSPAPVPAPPSDPA